MKIVDIASLAIPEVRSIRVARFRDHRGHFTEQLRRSDIHSQIPFLGDAEFVQANENFSHAGVIRGLHFQWNPYMGKLVRTVMGRMVDLVLDIRLGSPTFGKALAYDMPATQQKDYSEWLWVPPGFAHGNFFEEDSVIEYLCTGEHSPGCEAGISPLANDIDWTLCDSSLRRSFASVVSRGALISDKDKAAMTVDAWSRDSRASNFRYGELSRETSRRREAA